MNSRDKWNEKRRESRRKAGMRPAIPIPGADAASLFPHLVEELHPDNIETLDRLYPGSGKRLKWQCANGHVWETKLLHRTAGNNCIKCRPKMAEDEYKARRKESFGKWYYADNHGADKAARKRELRYLKVAELHGTICYLCNNDVARAETHLDHVTPRSAGGADSYANLRITHWQCNLAKGRKRWLGPDWVGYRLDIGAGAV
jgi:Probable Zinc-ribbon domain/HNH endonuclease